MNVWQIACGETGRRYDDLFLTHDVMFCGPGRYGPYNERVYSDSEEHISQLGSSNNGAVVDRLYQKVRELSGLTKQAAEELEKNSETTPGNSSPST